MQRDRLVPVRPCSLAPGCWPCPRPPLLLSKPIQLPLLPFSSTRKPCPRLGRSSLSSVRPSPLVWDRRVWVGQRRIVRWTVLTPFSCPPPPPSPPFLLVGRQQVTELVERPAFSSSSRESLRPWSCVAQKRVCLWDSRRERGLNSSLFLPPLARLIRSSAARVPSPRYVPFCSFYTWRVRMLKSCWFALGLCSHRLRGES